MGTNFYGGMERLWPVSYTHLDLVWDIYQLGAGADLLGTEVYGSGVSHSLCLFAEAAERNQIHSSIS